VAFTFTFTKKKKKKKQSTLLHDEEFILRLRASHDYLEQQE